MTLLWLACLWWGLDSSLLESHGGRSAACNSGPLLTQIHVCTLIWTLSPSARHWSVTLLSSKQPVHTRVITSVCKSPSKPPLPPGSCVSLFPCLSPSVPDGDTLSLVQGKPPLLRSSPLRNPL